MPVLESSIEIAADAGDVFALSQDYERRLEWDPFLGEARLLDGRTGVGARSWCATPWGLGMETEYVSYQPGRVAAVLMTRGPWPIAKFAGSWLFKPREAGTRVVFRYHVAARPRWLRWLLEPLMVRWFRRETEGRLRALKAFLERKPPT